MMQTHDLISMLASQVEPVNRQALLKDCALQLGAGLLVATLVMVAVFGINPALREALAQPMFWVKLAYPASLASLGLGLAWLAGAPGRSLGWLLRSLAVPVLLMLALAAVVMFNAEMPQRNALVFGTTWKVCAMSITLVSAPLFVAAIWALKSLAPTRLRLAGAAAGLLAGAAGTLVYAFHCPELAAPFVALWYTAGIAVPTLVGAALGPKLLRW